MFEAPAGTTTAITLHAFTGTATGSSDGARPQAPLYADAAGNLYGTTNGGGGSANEGVVFRLTGAGYVTPAVVAAAGQTAHLRVVNNGGQLQVRSTIGLTAAAGGTVAVDPAATPATRQLVVAVGTGLSLAGSAGRWTGTLDLANNDLDVHDGNLATITSQATQGFAGGRWNGSGGIVSSTAAADTGRLTAVGVIQNVVTLGGTTAIYTSFAGQAVAATDVLARYTYYGDANLDGRVDAADYTRIDAGFLTKLTGWQSGDFNYDGRVDASDYTLMDNAFNRQAGGVASPTTSVAGRVAVVPEPASLSAVVSVGLFARRRRPR